jgi:hypothetical protein
MDQFGIIWHPVDKFISTGSIADLDARGIDSADQLMTMIGDMQFCKGDIRGTEVRYFIFISSGWFCKFVSRRTFTVGNCRTICCGSITVRQTSHPILSTIRKRLFAFQKMRITQQLPSILRLQPNAKPFGSLRSLERVASQRPILSGSGCPSRPMLATQLQSNMSGPSILKSRISVLPLTEAN